MTTIHESISEGLFYATTMMISSQPLIDKVVCLDFSEHRINSLIRDEILKLNLNRNEVA